MSLQTILNSKGLSVCPIPIWKLKLSLQEFEDLGAYISNTANPRSLNGLEQEIAVYCAFWWQKKYKGGPHTLRDIKESLCLNSDIEEIQNAATKGLRQIEHANGQKVGSLTLKTSQQTAYLDSILYQGGLPLGLFVNMTNSESEYVNSWTRTIISILNGASTVKGQAAENSSSIKDFCERLYEAFCRDDFRLMPTCCSSKAVPLWIAVTARIKKIRTLINRVGINWEVKVDDIDKRIKHIYTITVPAQLNGNTAYNASVVVYKNNQSQHVFSYLNNYCTNRSFTDVCNKTSYLRLEGAGLERDFGTKDLAAPLLFEYKKGMSRFNDCAYSNIGETNLILFLDKNEWDIDSNRYASINYFDQWNEQNIVSVTGYNQYHVLLIPNTAKQIIIDNKQTAQSITLSSYANNSGLSIGNNPDVRTYPNFKEIVFNFDSENKPKICRGKSMVTNPCYIKNAVPYDEPCIGRQHIYDSNNMDISPIRNVISLGRKFSIKFDNKTADSCEATIKWEDGQVRPENGKLKNLELGQWLIEKDSENPEWIKLIFSENGSTNTFALHYKAPFADFRAKFAGRIVNKGKYIPLGDISSYRYALIGDIKTEIYSSPDQKGGYVFSDTVPQKDGTHSLTFHDACLKENFDIASEGGLEMLFKREPGKDGLWTLERLLDAPPCKDVVNAELNPQVTYNRNEWDCIIKRYPYRIDRFWNVLHYCLRVPSKSMIDKWNPIVVTSYSGDLYAISLEDDNLPPFTIEVKNGQGIIPTTIRTECENIPASRYGKVLILSKEEDRVLPRLEDMSLERGMTMEEREQNKIDTVQSIESQLREWKWNNDFDIHIGHCANLLRDYSMPPTSLLEFRLIARHSIPDANGNDLRNPENNQANHLIRLAFHLFMSDEWDSDEAKKFLLSLEPTSMLAFKWWWITENEIKNSINWVFLGATDNDQNRLEALKSWYITARLLESDCAEESYINSLIQDAEDPCEVLSSCQKRFVDWMKELIAESETMYRSQNIDCRNILNDTLIAPVELYFKNIKNIWDICYPERQELLYYITYEADAFYCYLSKKGIIK